VLVVICVLGGVAVAAALFLVVLELRRYLVDRTPLPPLSPDESARDHWNAWTADLIAALSVVAALLAWQASQTFGAASALDNLALQQSALYQAQQAFADSAIQFNARLTQLQQQHLIAEARLYGQVGGASNAIGAELRAEAHVEGAQARAFQQAFGAYVPAYAADGSETFDRTAQTQFARNLIPDLRILDAAHVAAVQAQAGVVRASAEKIVLAGALFIAGVFFMTIARLGWRNRRLQAAIPGTVAAIAGLVVLVAGIAT
jgi:hypothetical protein